MVAVSTMRESPVAIGDIVSGYTTKRLANERTMWSPNTRAFSAFLGDLISAIAPELQWSNRRSAMARERAMIPRQPRVRFLHLSTFISTRGRGVNPPSSTNDQECCRHWRKAESLERVSNSAPVVKAETSPLVTWRLELICLGFQCRDLPTRVPMSGVYPMGNDGLGTIRRLQIHGWWEATWIGVICITALLWPIPSLHLFSDIRSTQHV
jgi:hypothetical protein